MLSVHRFSVNSSGTRRPVSKRCTEAREGILDQAEKKLYERINEGERWAITLILSTLGKHRGYGLGANATLNLGDTNTLVVTSVNIIALPSGAQVGMGTSVVIRETLEPEPRPAQA